MKNRMILLPFIIMSLNMTTLAANIEISGIVVEAKTGNPLPGANVLIKGTFAGAATNANGEFIFCLFFVIMYKPAAISLEISYVT